MRLRTFRGRDLGFRDRFFRPAERGSCGFRSANAEAAVLKMYRSSRFMPRNFKNKDKPFTPAILRHCNQASTGASWLFRDPRAIV